jgi:transcriptional regulator with XRE-family HTH domain
VVETDGENSMPTTKIEAGSYAAHSKVRTRPPLPHENSQIAIYLTKQIEALSATKSQREIAAEMGYDKPNIISMFKRGETKVPLDKIPLLAKALHVDPAHLFRLALEQYWPNLGEVVAQIFGHTVSANEYELIKEIRSLTENTDPVFTEDKKKKLGKLIAESS